MTNFFKLTPEQLLGVFRRRASTRQYDANRLIGEEDFATILECGRLSPSSVGSEPWQFLIIQNRDLREKLKPVAWGMVNQLDAASHVVAILAKKNARYDSAFLREAMARRGVVGEMVAPTVEKYQSFQENDIKILESERALFDWASKQTYIALGNMMTAAAMLGIDSCPIEGFHYDEVNRILAETGAFDPAEWGVSVMLTLGYRAKDIRPKARKDLNEITVWIK